MPVEPDEPLRMLSAALADVLEVSGSGSAWIAGGPSRTEAQFTETAPTESVGSAQAGAVPITHIADSAGPDQWQSRVAQLATKYDISPQLLEALVWQESRWRPGAVSSAGARGLAQLMPGTARQLGVNPHDPDANLEGGARYLRQQLDAFGGDLEKALAAYNAGPGRVNQWLRLNGDPRTGAIDWVTWVEKIPANFETRYYIMRVIGNAVTYSHMYPDQAGLPRPVDAFLQ